MRLELLLSSTPSFAVVDSGRMSTAGTAPQVYSNAQNMELVETNPKISVVSYKCEPHL